MSNGGDPQGKPASAENGALPRVSTPADSAPSPSVEGVPHAASHLSGNPPPVEPEAEVEHDSAPPSIPSAASLQEGSLSLIHI